MLTCPSDGRYVGAGRTELGAPPVPGLEESGQRVCVFLTFLKPFLGHLHTTFWGGTGVSGKIITCILVFSCLSLDNYYQL